MKDKNIDYYSRVCTYSHILEAFYRARKGRGNKKYVRDFEDELENNLKKLQIELKLFCYRPKPLQTFIISDPKTRKISKSHFRDRIIHHAICMILEPIYEKCFIHDSYANRKGKGTLKAIEKYEIFKSKVTKNKTRKAYYLKTDIYHYFECVNHKILLNILSKKISDKRFLNSIKIIIENLNLDLHPNKTQIKLISQGIDFLGMRIYNNHRLIRKKNLRKSKRKYLDYKNQCLNNIIDYDKVNEFLEGWCAHSIHSNSFKFKQGIYKRVKIDFQKEVSKKEVLRILKYTKYIK